MVGICRIPRRDKQFYIGDDMIHDMRFWLAEIESHRSSAAKHDPTKIYRQMMRTIHHNRMAGGICEECDKNIQVDILRDYLSTEDIYSQISLEGLFDVLQRVIEYRQMLLNCTIHREWSHLCDCQDSERSPEPLKSDDIPF